MATPTPAATLGPSPSASYPAAGQMTVGRGYHAAALLADGRVLILGGYAAGSSPLASADLFDPRTGLFGAASPMTTARARGPSATRLADGRVLVTGGFDAKSTIASAELFDPSTGTFSAAGRMAAGRIYSQAILLQDGRVLVVGGDGDRGGLPSAEVYDPAKGAWTATSSMTTARTGHTATRLADGRVLIVGGRAHTSGGLEGGGPCLASAEVFDARTGRFTATGSMAEPRCGHTATLLADGRVLVTGGGSTYGYPTCLTSAEVYDPKTGTFARVGPMAVARIGQTATRLADGRVLIAGGNDGAYIPLASSELFDPRTGTFSASSSMQHARTWYTATLLASGRVLVAGGDSENWNYDGPYNTYAEVYDPATGTFGPAGPGS